MKNLKITLLIALIIFSSTLWSQVAINLDESPAHSSAMLDISTTDRGVLIPRLTTDQIAAAKQPIATSQSVFNPEHKIHVVSSKFSNRRACINNTRASQNEAGLAFQEGNKVSDDYDGCSYTIELWDSFGDGWNGCYLDVYVDGNLVLSQVTLDDGVGPAVFIIPVLSESLIQMYFEQGQWPYECYYYVYDSQGNLVFEDGVGGIVPEGGDVLANCNNTSATTDYGDAPEGLGGYSYPTTIASNGANHIIDPTVFLGARVDGEVDGQPSMAAVGDDNIPMPTDEDGVHFITSLVPGKTATIKVIASVDGFLNAWVDFDGNSDWAGEQVFTDEPLVAGPNYLSFNIPASAITGTTFTRFRYTTYHTGGTLTYMGDANDGEVEDHLIEIILEEDESKMHFPQWPDLTTNGVDVYCQHEPNAPYIVADDFKCMETGLITDIHIWGSWKDDIVPWDNMPGFKLGIWSDNPIGPSGHSEPDTLIWEQTFDQGQYNMDIYALVPDGEWFYEPHLNYVYFPGDTEVYKLNFYIPDNMACHQDSLSIYWLSVEAIIDPGVNYEFGWKSSKYHFNDYAVWTLDPPGWNILDYPNPHPLVEEYMDMAFYISGHPKPDVWIKDCDFDMGSVPSYMPCLGYVCAGPDIWIDNDGDGVMDNPVEEAMNRLYIRARNLGPGTANNVTASLYYRNSSTGLNFPTGATYIGNIGPLTIPAGGSVYDYVNWYVPAAPASGHYCIGGIVTAPYDPQTSQLSPDDNNLAFVNIWALYNRAGDTVPPKAGPQPTEANFLVRNPFEEPGSFVLDAEIQFATAPWDVQFEINGFPIDLPYNLYLDPYDSVLCHMTVTPPVDAQHGDGGQIIVKQFFDGPFPPDGWGCDITYPVSVDLYPPEAITDLEVTQLNESFLLSWTPATSDVNGNWDNIACYNIYKWPDTLDYIARVAVDDYPQLTKFNWWDPDPGAGKDENPVYVVKVEDEAGHESPISNLGYHLPDYLSLNVFLEGLYNGSDMNTILNADGFIPLLQPFNVPPWNYMGTESVTSMPNGDVVDWILVELRDAPDAISAIPYTIVDRQAAFILKDGRVVDLDGFSNLNFDVSINNGLFVVLWHRNHLGIMSAFSLTGSGGLYSYNFSAGESLVHGGAAGHKNIKPDSPVYSFTTSLTSGTVQFYKYINGNDWGGVEVVPGDCGIDDGQGGFNRVFITPENDAVMDVVCFSSCNPCNGSSNPVNVSFRVDMTGLTVSPNGVHLAGSFQGWDPSSTEMLPVGNNIYAVSLTLNSGEIETYKFINGNAWGEEEVVPFECSTQDIYNNRIIIAPENDKTLPPICFSSCNSCGTLPQPVLVTFRLDMTGLTISPNGVHVAGSFASWDPTLNEMTPGIWGMIAGDGDANGEINMNDKNNVWILQAGQEGYNSGDFNLDGQVNNPDKNDLWIQNINAQSQVPE